MLCIHTMSYAIQRGASRATSCLEPLLVLLVALAKPLPRQCRPHCSSFLILGPAGWVVLRGDRPDALSLALAYEAAPNVSGDSLVCGKSGRAPGAWATVVAPTAYKVIESDGRAEHGHGGVWQQKFLCRWTEVLREAEQCY